MTRRTLLPLLLTLALAGCGGASTDNAATPGAGNATRANAAEPSANSAAPAGELSVYVGQIPREPVNGVSFLAHPRVRAAVEAAVSDAAVRTAVLNEDTTQGPIQMRGERILAHACESHNCGPHQWAILIDPAGASAEVCYHDDRTAADSSRWYSGGRPPETRPGYCPPTDTILNGAPSGQ